jgi:hypothetical protein
MKTKVAEEYCWAMIGGGTVVLLPIKSQCVGVSISAGIPFI